MFALDATSDLRFAPALAALGPAHSQAVQALIAQINAANMTVAAARANYNLQPLLLPSTATYPGGPDYYTFDLNVFGKIVRVATADYGIGHVCVSARFHP